MLMNSELKKKKSSEYFHLSEFLFDVIPIVYYLRLSNVSFAFNDLSVFYLNQTVKCRKSF